ncbi:MAG: hypothetical protein NTW28_20935, partial [Candidatus Solibacter sp.]|nr:hypothetical protein [Candidatus Solibacter sp.]
MTGDTIQLSMSNRQGVRAGMRGYVHASETAGGRTVDVKITRLVVSEVSETRSVARVEQRSQGYTVAVGQRVSFAERLGAPPAKTASVKETPKAAPASEARLLTDVALWNAAMARKNIRGYEDQKSCWRIGHNDVRMMPHYTHSDPQRRRRLQRRQRSGLHPARHPVHHERRNALCHHAGLAGNRVHPPVRSGGR